MRWTSLAAAALLFGGCYYAVQEQTDLTVCDLASHAIDVQPAALADQKGSEITTAAFKSAAETQAASSQVQPTRTPDQNAANQLTRPSLTDRLRIPPGLPGSNVPPIQLPAHGTDREQYLRKLYPELPPLGPNPQPQPGPEGRPLTLADLQRLAMGNNPLIRQPAADVEAARGAVIQAGAYPNPTVAYEADNVGSADTAGFQGFSVDQMIKTGGKLKLAQAAAIMDLLNAQVALRRAQTDLANQVRAGYFAVLVAQENVRVTEALAKLTDEAFRIQVEQAVVVAAPYEPMQLRVLAYQARGALLTARNTYLTAWKQLAASLGLPGMPPTELAGRPDMAIPVFEYQKALAHILSTHTDVRTAENGIQKARYNLELAKRTPIPDVSVHYAIQKDFTTPPFNIAANVAIGVPVPIWDLNKGAIIQSQGQLLRAIEEPHRVRDDLSSRLADAYGRYRTNRELIHYYRDRILPDQVRAYQGVRIRHNVEPDAVSFGDVVTAQQTLATTLTTYVTTLGAMWTAVTDVANLLQTDDLFQIGNEAVPTECPAPVPDVEHLLALPCCHPCSGGVGVHLKETADAAWPETAPTAAASKKNEQQSTSTTDEETLPMPKLPTRPSEPRQPPPGHVFLDDRAPR
jgi:cobalt-zinc-cadmium efflux system outer membrane protein